MRQGCIGRLRAGGLQNRTGAVIEPRDPLDAACYTMAVNAIFEAAKEVAVFMQARHWRFCVIGGLAVQRWGEPRATLAADMTLLTRLGGEERYATPLLEAFRSRIPDALSFALARRVLLLKASNGKDVDICFGALPFEEEMIRRAIQFEFAPGLILPCCTAEDLFVMEAFASRSRDWLDAESVVTRQEHVDTDYLLQQLNTLRDLKEAPEIAERAQRILSRRP